MQDVTNVLYECLGRVTHIQNELQRQSSKGLKHSAPQSTSQAPSEVPPTVDEMMEKLERISTLSEIG